MMLHGRQADGTTNVVPGDPSKLIELIGQRVDSVGVPRVADRM